MSRKHVGASPPAAVNQLARTLRPAVVHGCQVGQFVGCRLTASWVSRRTRMRGQSAFASVAYASMVVSRAASGLPPRTGDLESMERSRSTPVGPLMVNLAVRGIRTDPRRGPTSTGSSPRAAPRRRAVRDGIEHLRGLEVDLWGRRPDLYAVACSCLSRWIVINWDHSQSLTRFVGLAHGWRRPSCHITVPHVESI